CGAWPPSRRRGGKARTVRRDEDKPGTDRLRAQKQNKPTNKGRTRQGGEAGSAVQARSSEIGPVPCFGCSTSLFPGQFPDGFTERLRRRLQVWETCPPTPQAGAQRQARSKSRTFPGRVYPPPAI